MEVSSNEIDNHLKQLALICALYDTAETQAEQDALNADFERVCTWMKERNLSFGYDGVEQRWKQVETA